MKDQRLRPPCHACWEARDGSIPLNLDSRLALRPAEAARALGISERTFRSLLPRIPHIRLDGAVLIPRKALEVWLDEKASVPADRSKEIAEELTRAIRGSVGE